MDCREDPSAGSRQPFCPGVIYVIRTASGPFKIGWATSPYDRLAVLQIGSIEPLTLVATYEHASARQLEAEIHRQLAPHRLRGEWFVAPLAQVDRAIRRAARVLRTRPINAGAPMPDRAPQTSQLSDPESAKNGADNKELSGASAPAVGADMSLIPLAAATPGNALAEVLADPELRADVEGAYSLNTMRAYRAAWADWAAWCARRGARPLPAEDRALRDYLADLSTSRKLSTLRLRLAAIARAHKLAGFQLERQAPAVFHVMRRLTRAKGTAQLGRAELLTPDILAMCKAAGDDLRGLRDRALLLLGFAAGLRRSEIVALDTNDIEWRRDGIVVHIRRSKTDQDGAGQEAIVAYGRREASCPVRALKAWIDRAQITGGPIWRPIVRANAVATGRLSDKAVWRVVKRLAVRAGLDPDRLGAHSLRVGHVTQALANGAAPADAQAQLRHRRLDTTLGYNRNRNFRGSSSGKLGL